MGESKRRKEKLTPFEKLEQEITRKLADEGKLIEIGWLGFRKMVISPTAPDFVVAQLREAFMAGAQHLFGSIMNALDPEKEPTENDMKRMDLIDRELRKFAEEFACDHYPTKGSA